LETISPTWCVTETEAAVLGILFFFVLENPYDVP